jgi:hypothetical protein
MGRPYEHIAGIKGDRVGDHCVIDSYHYRTKEGKDGYAESDGSEGNTGASTTAKEHSNGE